MMRLVRCLLVLAICCVGAVPAVAQTHASSTPPASSAPLAQQASFLPVGSVTFYSHSFGENFPHAFVIVEALNAQDQIVYEAFGFSAKHLSPKLLFGRVDGYIAIPGDRYIRQSTPHFSILVDANQMSNLYTVRANWEDNRYHLNKHNCVHFIAELAQTLGLKTNWQSDHFKEPASFLRELADLNPGLRGH